MGFLKWLLGKTKRHGIDDAKLTEELSHWKILSITNDTENIRAVVRIRTERPDLPNLAEFKTIVTVTWPYQSDRHMPDASTKAKMDAFEDRIEELSGENDFSYLIMIRTGMGERQWVYYTVDAERFRAAFDSLLSSADLFPIAVASWQDPSWEEWRTMLRGTV